MDCHLSIRVADPVAFLSECKNREKEGRKRFQQDYTPEQLEALRKSLAQRKAGRDARRAKRDAERSRLKKTSERDGRSFYAEKVGDFHNECRKADGGRFSVRWGVLPGEKERWVVLAFDGEKAKCCFKMNMRVMDCWIAECGEIIAVRLSNELIEEKEREFFAFLNKEGQAVGQAQFPSKWFRFLGNSETGSHYAWEYQGWLHLTESDTGTDFLNRKLPQGFYANVADFDSESSVIRLKAAQGMELKISWEDTPAGDLAAFAESFAEATRADQKASMLNDFWESHPEPGAVFASFLLPMLEEIDPDGLRDDSMWNSVTIPLYLRLGVAICEAAREADRTEAFQTKLTDYRNPFDTADVAHREVRAALEAGDGAALEEWEKKLQNALSGKRLERWPHLVAKCLRYLGEITQHGGRIEEARDFYKEALTLDKAAGCRRSLAQVEKRIAEIC